HLSARPHPIPSISLHDAPPILAAGTFTVSLKNNTTGLTSAGVSLSVSNPTPVINQVTTSPNPPVSGQAFTITLNGSNFDASNSTVRKSTRLYSSQLAI